MVKQKDGEPTPAPSPSPRPRYDERGYLIDDDPGYRTDDDPACDTTDRGGYQSQDDVAPRGAPKYSEEEDTGLPM